MEGELTVAKIKKAISLFGLKDDQVITYKMNGEEKQISSIGVDLVRDEDGNVKEWKVFFE